MKGFSPDVVTYTTLMKAFIRAKKCDKVLFHSSVALLLILKGSSDGFSSCKRLSRRISNFFWQVPEIYKEMECAGCTPDRKARQMLKVALNVLEQN